jgi:hypothetical protein
MIVFPHELCKREARVAAAFSPPIKLQSGLMLPPQIATKLRVEGSFSAFLLYVAVQEDEW